MVVLSATPYLSILRLFDLGAHLYNAPCCPPSPKGTDGTILFLASNDDDDDDDDDGSCADDIDVVSGHSSFPLPVVASSSSSRFLLMPMSIPATITSSPCVSVKNDPLRFHTVPGSNVGLFFLVPSLSLPHCMNLFGFKSAAAAAATVPVAFLSEFPASNFVRFDAGAPGGGFALKSCVTFFTAGFSF